MACIHDTTLESFIVPSSSLAVGLTSGPSQLNHLYVARNPESSVLETMRGLIKKPRRVKKDAWREFKTELHDLVPQLKNMTDEEIESLADERSQDFLDNDS